MEMPKKKISKSAEETLKIASEIAQEVENQKNTVICLKGNLGTGKTTFVKGFCEYFGIDNATVKSPTYTYYRLYEGKNNNIYHFDYYRLTHVDEIVENELIEIIDKENTISLIEWPEKVEDLLPKGVIVIDFAYGEAQDERIINISQN